MKNPIKTNTQTPYVKSPKWTDLHPISPILNHKIPPTQTPSSHNKHTSTPITKTYNIKNLKKNINLSEHHCHHLTPPSIKRKEGD